MNLVSGSILIVLLFVVVLASRRWALLAMMAGVLFLTQGHSIEILGLNLYPIRFLEVAAFSRVLLRGELAWSKLNRIDLDAAAALRLRGARLDPPLLGHRSSAVRLGPGPGAVLPGAPRSDRRSRGSALDAENSRRSPDSLHSPGLRRAVHRPKCLRRRRRYMGTLLQGRRAALPRQLPACNSPRNGRGVFPGDVHRTGTGKHSSRHGLSSVDFSA